MGRNVVLLGRSVIMLLAVLFLPAYVLAPAAARAEEAQTKADSTSESAPYPMPNWDVPQSDGAREHTDAVEAYTNNTQRIAELCDGLRPLDDPANPYRGLYAPIDFWAFERLKGLTSEPYKLHLHLTYSYGSEPFEVPEGWRVTIKTISPEGYLIPQFINGIRDEYRFDRPTVGETLGLNMLGAEDWGGQQMDWIAIVAPLDWDGLQLDSSAKHSDFIEALDFPRVPAWLVRQPPIDCVFVPNGDILCYGELGKEFVGGPYYSVKGERWYRYDRTGRLLGTLDPPDTDYYSNWRLFYWPDMTVLKAEARNSERWLNARSGGYSTLEEPAVEGQEAGVLIYEYDGSPVDTGTPYDHSRSNMGTSWPPEYLLDMYEAQVQLGLVDPDLPSPYEGQADGPQRFSGGPVLPSLVLEQRTMAEGYTRKIRCIAKSPHDPANPHAADYEELDWYLAQLALLEPMTRSVKLEDKRYSAYAEAVSALNLRLGYAPPDPPLPTEFEQPWQISQSNGSAQSGTVQFPQVQFDAQGFMLPTREMYRRGLLFPGNFDLRPLELPYVQPRSQGSYDYATGQDYLGGLKLSAPLPAKLQARYDELVREADQQLAPALPAWAAGRDFYAWLPVANGELVLLSGTPLHPDWVNYAFELDSVSRTGYMGMNSYVPEVGECLEGMSFERWSADGRLLASLDAKETLLWQRLYWPGLSELIAAADSNSKQRQDFFLRNRNGFVLQYQNDREHYDEGRKPVLLAAYDFDGTALDISQPVRRDDSSCRWFMKPGVEAYEIQLLDGQIDAQPITPEKYRKH